MSTAALERFVESLPDKPYATDDLRVGLFVTSKALAVRAAYVQLHGTRRAYLPFDIDREGAAFAWEEAGLPQPTLIAINPQNAHAHLLYELSAPVAFKDRYGRGGARDRPMHYYRAVLGAYGAALKADPAYVGIVTKNPLSDQWKVLANDRAYELGELAESVDLKRFRPFDTAIGIDPEKLPQMIPQGYRNDIVFDTARKLAYGRVRSCGSYEDLFNVVMNITASINSRCVPPLSDRESMGIARSIARYCWRKRDILSRGCKNRGVLGFNPLPPVMLAKDRLEEVKRRKSAGAQYVNDRRKAENRRKIETAIQQLIAQGKRVSKAAVSRLSGLSRQTVSAPYYADLFP